MGEGQQCVPGGLDRTERERSGRAGRGSGLEVGTSDTGSVGHRHGQGAWLGCGPPTTRVCAGRRRLPCIIWPKYRHVLEPVIWQPITHGRVTRPRLLSCSFTSPCSFFSSVRWTARCFQAQNSAPSPQHSRAASTAPHSHLGKAGWGWSPGWRARARLERRHLPSELCHP